MRWSLLIAVLLAPLPAPALERAAVVRGLEALGEWEAAYPLAVDLARKQGDYPAWREVAAKYALYDLDAAAYRSAWEQARAIDTFAVYRDFLTLREQSPLNPLALHRLYALTRELDTVSGYQDFMQAYPDSVEAAAALLRVHELSFARARAADEPELYDAFVALFPGARQVPDAIEAAYQVQKRAVEAELEGGLLDFKARFFADQSRDRVARRLYNEARRAVLAQRRLAADRNYRLLDLEVFADTAALTEHLDREERLAWREHQRQAAERAGALQRELGQAVVAAVQAEGARIEGAVERQGERLESAIAHQGDRLDAAIREHNRVVARRFDRVYRDMDQGLSEVAEQVSGVYSDVNQQLGQIGQAVREQTDSMTRAANESRYQQQRLYDRAADEARRQSYRSRRCAAELAKHGRALGMFSSCK